MSGACPRDGVLLNLVAAGMNAATVAATAEQDVDQKYAVLLEQITYSLVAGYGARTLFRELCSAAGLVLTLRGLNVRIGELVCSRDEGVWTFHIEPPVNPGLHRAAQLVCVYANVQEQYAEEWAEAGNPFWEPSVGATSDEDAWEQLVQAIPDGELVPTGKALFVTAGVLSKWASTTQPTEHERAIREASHRLLCDDSEEASPE